MQECIGTPAFADFKGENMLYIADDIHKIKYGLLMELYAQDLQKDAQKHYGRLSLNEGIFMPICEMSFLKSGVHIMPFGLNVVCTTPACVWNRGKMD